MVGSPASNSMCAEPAVNFVPINYHILTWGGPKASQQRGDCIRKIVTRLLECQLRLLLQQVM